MPRRGKFFQNRKPFRDSRSGRGRSNLPKRPVEDHRMMMSPPYELRNELVEQNIVPLDRRNERFEGRDGNFHLDRSPMDDRDGNFLKERGLLMNDIEFIDRDFLRDRSPIDDRDGGFPRNRHPSIDVRDQDFLRDRSPHMYNIGPFIDTRGDDLPRALDPFLRNRDAGRSPQRRFLEGREEHVDGRDFSGGNFQRQRSPHARDNIEMGFPMIQNEVVNLDDEFLDNRVKRNDFKEGEFPRRIQRIIDRDGGLPRDRHPHMDHRDDGLLRDMGPHIVDRDDGLLRQMGPLIDDSNDGLLRDRGPLGDDGLLRDRGPHMDGREDGLLLDRSPYMYARDDGLMGDRGPLIDDRDPHMNARDGDFMRDRDPHIDDRDDNFLRGRGPHIGDGDESLLRNRTPDMDDRDGGFRRGRNPGKSDRDVDLQRDRARDVAGRDGSFLRGSGPHIDDRDDVLLRNRIPDIDDDLLRERNLCIDDRDYSFLRERGLQDDGLMREMGPPMDNMDVGFLRDRGTHLNEKDNKKPLRSSRSRTEDIEMFPSLKLNDLRNKLNFRDDRMGSLNEQDDNFPMDRGLHRDGRGTGIDNIKSKFLRDDGEILQRHRDGMLNRGRNVPMHNRNEDFPADRVQMDKGDGDFHRMEVHAKLFTDGRNEPRGAISKANRGRSPSRDRKQGHQGSRNRRHSSPTPDERRFSPRRSTSNKVETKTKSSTERRYSPYRKPSRDKQDYRKSSDRNDFQQKIADKSFQSPPVDFIRRTDDGYLEGNQNDDAIQMQMTVEKNARAVQLLPYKGSDLVKHNENIPKGVGRRSEYMKPMQDRRKYQSSQNNSQSSLKQNKPVLNSIGDKRDSKSIRDSKSTADRKKRTSPPKHQKTPPNSFRKDSEKHNAPPRSNQPNFKDHKNPSLPLPPRSQSEINRRARWASRRSGKWANRRSGKPSDHKNSQIPSKTSGRNESHVKKSEKPTIPTGNTGMPQSLLSYEELQERNQQAMQQMMYKQLEILGLLNPTLQQHLSEQMKLGAFGGGTQPFQSNSNESNTERHTIQKSNPVSMGEKSSSDKPRFSADMPRVNVNESRRLQGEVQPVKLPGISLTEADIDNFLKSKRDAIQVPLRDGDQGVSEDLTNENMETIKKSMLEFLMKMSKEQNSDGSGDAKLSAKHEGTRSPPKPHLKDTRAPLKSSTQMTKDAFSKPGGLMSNKRIAASSADPLTRNRSVSPPNFHMLSKNEQMSQFQNMGVDTYQDNSSSENLLPIWGTGTKKLTSERMIQIPGLDLSTTGQFNTLNRPDEENQAAMPIGQQQNEMQQSNNLFPDAGKRLFEGNGRELKNLFAPGSVANQFDNTFRSTGIHNREQTMSKPDGYRRELVSEGNQIEPPTVHDWNHMSVGSSITTTPQNTHKWNRQTDENKDTNTPQTIPNWNRQMSGNKNSNTEQNPQTIQNWNRQMDGNENTNTPNWNCQMDGNKNLNIQQIVPNRNRQIGGKKNMTNPQTITSWNRQMDRDENMTTPQATSTDSWNRQMVGDRNMTNPQTITSWNCQLDEDKNMTTPQTTSSWNRQMEVNKNMTNPQTISKWNFQMAGNSSESMNTPQTGNDWNYQADRSGGGNLPPNVHEWNHQSMAPGRLPEKSGIQPPTQLTKVPTKLQFHGKGKKCSPLELLLKYSKLVMKCKPVYIFQETESFTVCCTVYISGKEYATEFAANKKDARKRAAYMTMCMLCPEQYNVGNMKEYLADNLAVVTDETFFDDISIDDPRLQNLTFKAKKMTPYTILKQHIYKLGMKETDIKVNFQASANRRVICTMSIGTPQKLHWQVTLSAMNEAEGRKKAVQSILQIIHPDVESYGKLLEIYETGYDRADNYPIVAAEPSWQKYKTTGIPIPSSLQLPKIRILVKAIIDRCISLGGISEKEIFEEFRSRPCWKQMKLITIRTHIDALVLDGFIMAVDD